MNRVTPVNADATIARVPQGCEEAKESTPVGRRRVAGRQPRSANPWTSTGKKFAFVALGDQIPVIHGGRRRHLGGPGRRRAEVKICDGKFNPTAVADCLKAAGDEQVDGVISAFVDYQMAGPAFDALAAKGVKVIVGGVAPSGGREADANLAFYDNTPRVFALYEAMSEAAVADGGQATNVLWVRLWTPRRRPGRATGGRQVQGGLPELRSRHGRLHDGQPRQAGHLGQRCAGVQPGHQCGDRAGGQLCGSGLQGIQAAKFAGKVKVHSSSSDLAGLQRIKDGQQVSDLGTPVLFEGWKFANAMVQLISGQEVEKGKELVTRAFTKDNVGSLTLDDKPYLTDDWFGGGAYKQKFLAAWGIK